MDYKTTGSSIDLAKYHDALQWRFYLAALPTMQRFDYEIFQLNKSDKVTDHKTLTLYRYDALEQDVFNKVREYANFIRSLVANGAVQLDSQGRIKKT